MSTALFSIRLKVSMIRRNSRGDNGSPYLKPLELGKKPWALPFTKMEKRAVEM
jgi:hypothetical protein